MNKKGVCYGVSVGPGDPSLLTKKAIKILESSDYIFLPSYPREDCKVYQIIKAALPEISEEKYICIETAKMADPALQGDRYDILADRVAELLDQGMNVAFPALGEVALYSTYMYVHERLLRKNYELKLISGISSVQEIADRMGIPLALGNEELHIFPDTNDLLSRLEIKGTKVFMKPKGNLSEAVETIKNYASKHENTIAVGISNCGTNKEIAAKSVNELSNLSGYMTVIIVK